MASNQFIHVVRDNRERRHWSLAELARRAQLSQPEVSRLEGGKRMPTMRHVRGLATAFSTTPAEDDPGGYPEWLTTLVDLAEDARKLMFEARNQTNQS